MNERTRVYVTYESDKMNYSPAEKYGDVHFVTGTDLSPMKNSHRNKEIEKDFKYFCTDYMPGSDYLVLTGSTVFVAWFMMKLYQACPNKPHKILRWDNISRSYQVYTIEE
jgi:hypothetical protein